MNAHLVRRLQISSGVYFGALVLGLGAGAVAPEGLAPVQAAIPALGLQTLLTVGALPKGHFVGTASSALRLYAVHHVSMTLPLLVVALLAGLDTAVGFGIFIMAVAPTAALVPAFAEALEIDTAPVLAFCVVSYSLGLVVTPLAVYLAAGASVGVGPIAYTLGVGLVGPALVGRALRPWVQRLHARLRRAIVVACIFVVTATLGGGIVDAFQGGTFGQAALLGLAAVAAGRTFGTGWFARQIAPDELSDAASFSGAFKNIALSAGVAGTLFGPTAAVPALLCFPTEALFFLWLGRRAVRRAKSA